MGDPLQELASLEAAVNEHTKVPSLEAHHALYDVEREVAESIARAAQCTATVDLVVGARAHHEAMTRALAEAKQQVVLACPWVNRLALDEVRDQIEGAVASGVLVCLLWGMQRGDSLDEETKRFLGRLAQHPSGGRMVAAERPAVSHAKVIACDHDWLIVSSCNFLNSGPDRTTDEVGVRLTSPPPRVEADPNDQRTAPSHPISEILRWVRDIMPDFRLRARIIDSPALLGMSERSQRAPTVDTILPPRLDLNDQMRQLSTKLWSREWRQRVAQLRRQLEAARPVAIPVRDVEHRELFLYALEHAERRLHLESPDVAAAGLSAPVVDALKRARARGVDVRLRYQKREIAGEEGDARWRSLAEAGVGLTTADTHAKLLVCDDWAVVGSFNFLSFAGRGRGELGVRIFDAELAGLLSTRFAST
ncbi:hypothetical protein BE17_29265 [Sorangium cellulosum]|uniref:Phospholipase D-like domain-containing protein n=1 Tax=Sorangium cellulosum TaxID=56 RepID=A0A150RQD0_SORCE|nr:hypothetical protein BE17_29265 [Sorangium cellulosum]